MADRSIEARLGVVKTWRLLNVEQRVAAVGSVLLIASTFGRFSFVEAAVVVTALAILALLRQRAYRRRFHLPFGDGTVILAAGTWSALLIVARVFDRPFGQSVLALACAAIVAGAGLRERTKRPPDDLPPAPARPAPPPAPSSEDPTQAIQRPHGPTKRRRQKADGDHATEPLFSDDDATVRLAEERGDDRG